MKYRGNTCKDIHNLPLKLTIPEEEKHQSLHFSVSSRCMSTCRLVNTRGNCPFDWVNSNVVPTIQEYEENQTNKRFQSRRGLGIRGWSRTCLTMWLRKLNETSALNRKLPKADVESLSAVSSGMPQTLLLEDLYTCTKVWYRPCEMRSYLLSPQGEYGSCWYFELYKLLAALPKKMTFRNSDFSFFCQVYRSRYLSQASTD